MDHIFFFFIKKNLQVVAFLKASYFLFFSPSNTTLIFSETENFNASSERKHAIKQWQFDEFYEKFNLHFCSTYGICKSAN